MSLSDHLITDRAADLDPTPTDWTWTDMGSGAFASAAFAYAAYVKNPMYRSIFGAELYPDMNLSMGPVDAACYTRSPLTTGAAPWNRFFYLGGPGGDAAGCN